MKNESLSYKIMEILRYTAHVILVALSLILSIRLFMEFSQDPIEKWFFGAMAFAMEAIKMWVYIRGVHETFGSLVQYKKKVKAKKRISGIGKLLLYIVLAGISVIASIGFSLYALNSQEFSAGSSSLVLNNNTTRIAEITAEIADLQRRKREQPGTWVTAGQRSQDAIAVLVAERQALIDSSVEESEKVIQVTTDIFSDIAGYLPWETTGRDFMLVLLIVLTILLEVGAIVTAPRETTKEELEFEEEEIYSHDAHKPSVSAHHEEAHTPIVSEEKTSVPSPVVSEQAVKPIAPIVRTATVQSHRPKVSAQTIMNAPVKLTSHESQGIDPQLKEEPKIKEMRIIETAGMHDPKVINEIQRVFPPRLKGERKKKEVIQMNLLEPKVGGDPVKTRKVARKQVEERAFHRPEYKRQDTAQIKGEAQVHTDTNKSQLRGTTKHT
jgi:hypothetical protein